MRNRWKALSKTTKFSIIAAIVVAPLGLGTMGLLGALLYYPVSFLFASYPDLNDWTGDWVWPATIVVGMLWSVGFILGGITNHFLRKLTKSRVILIITYVLTLMAWAALLWFITINNNVEPV